jgi:acetyl-CoA carboxylase carboxyl transferase subunit alpha
MMLQYSVYSVISPEGCASILYKSADRAADAAEAMGITSNRLKELGLVDRVVDEPLGGAHREPDVIAASLKQALTEELAVLKSKSISELLEERTAKLRGYGEFKEGE